MLQIYTIVIDRALEYARKTFWSEGLRGDYQSKRDYYIILLEALEPYRGTPLYEAFENRIRKYDDDVHQAYVS